MVAPQEDRRSMGISENLTDDVLRKLWRSVQGPHADLNGPLIRYAHKVAEVTLALRQPPAAPEGAEQQERLMKHVGCGSADDMGRCQTCDLIRLMLRQRAVCANCGCLMPNARQEGPHE